jgi:hypothetical protein
MTDWAEQQGPSALRQALSSPAVQQGIKMVAPYAKAGLGIAGLGGAMKFLKSIGIIHGGINLGGE